MFLKICLMTVLIRQLDSPTCFCVQMLGDVVWVKVVKNTQLHTDT